MCGAASVWGAEDEEEEEEDATEEDESMRGCVPIPIVLRILGEAIVLRVPAWNDGLAFTCPVACL